MVIFYAGRLHDIQKRAFALSFQAKVPESVQHLLAKWNILYLTRHRHARRRGLAAPGALRGQIKKPNRPMERPTLHSGRSSAR